MNYTYTHGRYRVRYSVKRDRYIVVTLDDDELTETCHGDYPVTASGLQLAKAPADLQAMREKEMLL